MIEGAIQSAHNCEEGVITCLRGGGQGCRGTQFHGKMVQATQGGPPNPLEGTREGARALQVREQTHNKEERVHGKWGARLRNDNRQEVSNVKF